MSKRVKTLQLGNKLFILDGMSPLRYVDLTTDKVIKYKPTTFDNYYKFFYKVTSNNLSVGLDKPKPLQDELNKRSGLEEKA